MAVPDEDRALSSAIKAGDSAACETFDARYRQKIEWLVRRRGVRTEDCADIAQEILAAAFNQIQRGVFRGDSRVGTWLEAIVHGKVVDYLRSPAKRPIPSEASCWDHPDMDVAAAGGALINRPKSDLVLTVRELVQTLPPRHRMILILSKVGGYTTVEIARRLGWPKGTVGRILAEAQQMFRVMFAASEESSSTLRQSRCEGNE